MLRLSASELEYVIFLFFFLFIFLAWERRFLAGALLP